jgi:hypothetical protein
MKTFFSAIDGTQENAFSFDLEPLHVRGGRSAFGAYILIMGLLEAEPTKAQPLEIGGWLSWPGDAGIGLIIPRQPVAGGTTGLTVPISDSQLASIESRRCGGEPNFEIVLTALARRSDQQTASYRFSWSPQPFPVPRDRWADALAACGHGRIRIIELPVAPNIGDSWDRSAQMLARASAEFGDARYGEAMGNARNALQDLVGILEQNLGIEPSSSFAQRVKVVGDTLTAMHAKRGADPYAVLASTIRAVADFCSDPMHRGYDIPNREDAAFALALATALHAFLARRPIVSNKL